MYLTCSRGLFAERAVNEEAPETVDTFPADNVFHAGGRNKTRHITFLICSGIAPGLPILCGQTERLLSIANVLILLPLCLARKQRELFRAYAFLARGKSIRAGVSCNSFWQLHRKVCSFLFPRRCSGFAIRTCCTCVSRRFRPSAS